MQLQNRSRGVPSSTTETVERLLADIGKLAPDIRARAAEIEAGRRVPPDLVAALKSIGIFRIFAPRSHGGFELDLSAGLEVFGALARIDGSVGWTAMIGNGIATAAPQLPRETYEKIYRNGPDVIFAGSGQPAGTAEAVAGGLRVNGRWSFASGCQHADWIFVFCVMTKDGKPLTGSAGAGGPPMIRAILLPARDVVIEDTWHAAGLKGSGSHHIAINNMLVPEANSLDVEQSMACVPGPLYQSLLHFIPLMHGNFAVAIAEGALDELVALANTGRQQLRAAVPMRESEAFQLELGRAAADIRAARAYLQMQTAIHWQHALAGTLKGEDLMIEGRQAGIWITTACLRAVDACFTLSGASAVYDDSPLQQRLRDLHVAAQHAAVQSRFYAGAGKVLLDAAAVKDAPAKP